MKILKCPYCNGALYKYKTIDNSYYCKICKKIINDFNKQ